MEFENFKTYLRALEPGDYETSFKWRKEDRFWRNVIGPKYFGFVNRGISDRIEDFLPL